MERRSDGLTLEIECVLPASPDRAFQALADADLLRRWWGPEGFTIPRLDWRPEPGKQYRIEMQPPDGEPFHLLGEFRKVEPPERLVFTFAWEQPDPDDVEMVASLELLDLHGSTELTLNQGPFRTEARRELHREGWRDSIEKLERLLGDGRPG